MQQLICGFIVLNDSAPITSITSPTISFGNGWVIAPNACLVNEQFVIVADLNLSNRDEFVLKLGKNSDNPAELILWAYQKWGDELCKYLFGEFVYLIFHRDCNKIIIARDRFGFKTLYYSYKPNEYFAFADKISNIPNFKALCNALDSQKIKQYLSPSKQYKSFDNRTFYQFIKAAIPAYQLCLHGEQSTHTHYWQPKPQQYTAITNQQEYIELFKDFFLESTKNCIAGYKNIGTHLSGGLDSSSVACVANYFVGNISTFYVNPQCKSTDETFYVNSVIKHIQSKHFEVNPKKDVLAALFKLANAFDRPEHFVIPSSFHFASAEIIEQQGIDLILTGHDGDTVVGSGNDIITTYRDLEDWQKLGKAIHAYAAERDLSHIRPNWLDLPQNKKQSIYTEYYVHQELWKMVRKLDLKRIARLAQTFRQEFGVSYSSFFRFLLDKLVDKIRYRANFQNIEFVNDFSTQTDNSFYLNGDSIYSELASEFLEQFRAITNKNYVDSTEQLKHIGVAFNHHYAHPFFNEKLIELSLAIPDEIKFGLGKGRDTIRQALQGILPEEVRNRGFKTSFGEYSLETFKVLYQQSYEIFDSTHLLWNFVEKENFRKIHSFLVNDKIPIAYKSNYTTLANKVLYLGIWLENLKHYEKIQNS